MKSEINLSYQCEMDYEKATYKELLIAWANCIYTYSTCGGHDKAYRNAQRIEALEEEMRRRGMTVPNSEVAYTFGTFNGKGAY